MTSTATAHDRNRLSTLDRLSTEAGLAQARAHALRLRGVKSAKISRGDRISRLYTQHLPAPFKVVTGETLIGAQTLDDAIRTAFEVLA